MLSARPRGWQRPAKDSPLPPFESFDFQWRFLFSSARCTGAKPLLGQGSGRWGRWGMLTSVSSGAMH